MDFKEFLKYSGLITGLLIFLGFFKLWIYFSFFKINIINYLELTEIIVLFLNDVIILAFLIITSICFVIYVYLWRGLTFNREKYEKRIELFKSKNTFYKRLKYYILKKESFFVLMFIFALFILINNIISGADIINITVNIVNTTFIFLLLINRILDNELKLIYFVKHDMPFISHFFTYLNYFLMALTAISFSALLSVNKVKNDYKYYGTEITIKDNIYKSDSTEYYIGKTRNYIFFYNDTSKVVNIFPMEEVSKISLKVK